jgi:hypothetical protein
MNERIKLLPMATSVVFGVFLWGCHPTAPVAAGHPATSPTADELVAAMEQGDARARAGDDGGALTRYLWCFEKGVDDGEFFGLRHSVLLQKIAALGKRFPDARKALQSRRDRLEKEIIRSAKSGVDAPVADAGMYADINDVLDEKERSVRTYEMMAQALPPTAKARADLFEDILPHLLAVKQYRVILAQRDVLGPLLASRLSKLKRAHAGPELPKEIVRHILELPGSLFEALLGVGDRATALAIADKVISIEGTGQTFAVFIEHAMRSGDKAMAQTLYDRARRVTTQEDLPLLDAALKVPDA